MHIGTRTRGMLLGLLAGVASVAVMPFFMAPSAANGDGLSFLCRLYGIHAPKSAVVKQPAAAPSGPVHLTTFGSSPR